MFREIEAPGYEQVAAVEDAASGLRAFIAIHSTRLGPSAGGVRLRAYASDDAALQDALNLARGMSYKNAAASLPLGGGKAVIPCTPEEMTPEKWRAFGDAVEALGGRYWTAEDMGVTPDDLALVAERTSYVAGLEGGAHGSGDPSPFTAKGVFDCMEATLGALPEPRGLEGARVAVQGLGHVGWRLCEQLTEAGAQLTVSDVATEVVARAEREFGALSVAPDAIYGVEADVFAPCAIGGVLNADTIPQLKVDCVVGAANNQLATSADDERLQATGILYAPDYVVNAGGIINVASEILKVAAPDEWVREKLATIAPTLREIYALAKSEGDTPANAADRLIGRRLELES